MSKYFFNTEDTGNRVKLHSDFVKRAAAAIAHSNTTRKSNMRWDTDEVVKACELYTSGWSPKEVAKVMDRPYISVSNKLMRIVGKRTGLAKFNNPACILHHENRIRSIVGQKLMTWKEAIKKVN
jgi:hypothetical protein